MRGVARITTAAILAVLGEGSLTSRTDRVISYDSAHSEGVVSEKILRSRALDAIAS